MQLSEGRIPMSPAEHGALDDLVRANPGLSVSATRRDPGEAGPLLVHVGDKTYEVDGDGRARWTGPAG